MTEPKYLPLSLPRESTRRERRGFRKLCELLADNDLDAQREHRDHKWWIQSAGLGDLFDQPYLNAAAHTCIDLLDQGWIIENDRLGALFTPPELGGDRDLEKARVRRQEHLRRDEQLRRTSVRNFIKRMERPRVHRGQLTSVFDLMRDGNDLADSLAQADQLSGVIDPYIQFADATACPYTGIPLQDIWRYFRHTWSNAYATVPGRSMPILVRDAATSHHAVIGIAAISSPVVQIAERDRWIGWETDQYLSSLAERPTLAAARWFHRRLSTQLDELYVADLLRDGVLQPSDLATPTPDVIGRLRADADRHRQRHHRNSVIRQVKNIGDAWIERAETDLFRSKRSAALAETLEALFVLQPYLEPSPTVKGLSRALADSNAKGQLRKITRRARGERVGTVIADLTVCGAVPPYNALAAGKLVGALAVSPPVLLAYRRRYSRPSEIASSMAGRPIEREARLSFIGTTSLYGTGSSQYNRLFWPADVFGGSPDDRIGYYELGRSRSFGTSHFSDQTVESLVRLAAVAGNITRVNSLFGEGVSPRLRKVRIGLSTLGWPTDELLKHGRERIVYGVPLVRNLRDYSLGIEKRPDYLFDPNCPDAQGNIAEWWFDRWGRRRAAQDHVIASMRRNSRTRPASHGARVPLPQDDLALELDFDALPSETNII